MNEIDIMKRAKMYLDKLSQGINPLDDTNVSPDDIVNNDRISRCFQYVSQVLGEVIDNGGIVKQKKSRKNKADFSITAEQLDKFNYSDEPITLSEIVHRINALIDVENMKNIKITELGELLVDMGVLKIVELPNGSKRKTPDELGFSIGVSVENRTSLAGKQYPVNLYSRTAQEFIINNLSGMDKNTPEN